ncbi:MAG: type III secretion inner membrane ring lipoprotein SctJ [Chlamydiota bacterium]
MKKCLVFLSLLFVLAGCDSNSFVVNDIDEREANEIIVFLASRGIVAQKVEVAESAAAAATGPSNLWSITVNTNDQTQAMALLNQAGLPRRKGMSLLELFAKQGLMSSDREENIRFQAGLAEELQNTIIKMDGVIDADVQISFPIEEGSSDAVSAGREAKAPITAAVYIKHIGAFDDPNSQLETKVKRLLAGSVQGLDFDHVSVISDRSKFADITLNPGGEMIAAKNLDEGYVSIWSVVMTKGSAGRFRAILVTMMLLIIALGSGFLWIFFRSYPTFTQSALRRVRRQQTKEKETPTEE